eukprot:GFUD01001244.1.p1 GENE.GFUD01001244.1~~GFUD01001244.1.p1  ORF type:complete len:270 (-),score=68.11 GFUD01001244.1:334-1143(-)
MSYFYGVSVNNGTKPGFKKTSEKFGVCFEGVECESVANDVKIKLETYHNWSQVIDIILASLEFFHDASNVEDDLQNKVNDWLGNFEGFGLLFTFLPSEIYQYFLLNYFHILKTLQEDEDMYSHNNMSFQVDDDIQIQMRNPIPYQDAFHRLKTLYELESGGLPFSDLIPMIEVKFLQLAGGPKDQERRKILLIKFKSSYSKFNFIAKFTIEKKRLRRTLAEIAAEVVGQMVEDSKDLEIPDTLKEVVSDKIVDADWVSDCWLTKVQNSP